MKEVQVQNMIMGIIYVAKIGVVLFLFGLWLLSFGEWLQKKVYKNDTRKD